MKNLEIACFNYESALIAQQGGANRVELCASYQDGGLTPGFETVNQTLSNLHIEVYVMIRPRAGNFVYSPAEIEAMKTSIIQLKAIGVHGFVFGILDPDAEVNLLKNSELVQLANPLPCTFHRAFDRTTDPQKTLEQIIHCGFKTILTSGAKPNAMDGILTLNTLLEMAQNRITLMPGGGVRSSNINSLCSQVNTTWYHSSAITDNSDMANLQEVKALKAELA